ncbi:MAG: LapA family protein [Deltaproteobacteria bacterium]|nr:LapA family protein [Deltaproteobacteria bacterium]
MKHIKAIIVVLFLLVVVIVAVQNYQALTTPISFKVNLLFFKAETSGLPVFLIAIITFLIGVICIWLYGISERIDFRRRIKSLMKDVREKEQELNSLRNLPVTSEDMNSGEAPVNT